MPFSDDGRRRFDGVFLRLVLHKVDRLRNVHEDCIYRLVGAGQVYAGQDVRNIPGTLAAAVPCRPEKRYRGAVHSIALNRLVVIGRCRELAVKYELPPLAAAFELSVAVIGRIRS